MNEQWALTAAVCVYDRKKRAPVRPEAINLGYDSVDLVEMFDQNKFVDVDQIVLHPDFSLRPSANLALLKLKTPFKFDDNIQPACLELDHPRQIYRQQLVGFGFGVTGLRYDGRNEEYLYTNNSRYLKESALQDKSGKLTICYQADLDETVCLSGTGARKFDLNCSNMISGVNR